MKILLQTDDHPASRTRPKLVIGAETINPRTQARTTVSLHDVASQTLLDYAYFVPTYGPKEKPFITGWHESGRHDKCPLLLVQPNGLVITCRHELHGSIESGFDFDLDYVFTRDDRRRCRNCADHLEPKRMLRGDVMCVDPKACRERFEHRVATDPGFARVVAWRPTETDEDGAQKPLRNDNDVLDWKDHERGGRLHKASKPGKPPNICGCGCGETTKGGRFKPGHDARYHAAQKRAATA